jgi:hypothetical protein
VRDPAQIGQKKLAEISAYSTHRRGVRPPLTDLVPLAVSALSMFKVIIMRIRLRRNKIHDTFVPHVRYAYLGTEDCIRDGLVLLDLPMLAQDIRTEDICGSNGTRDLAKSDTQSLSILISEV